MFFNRIKRFIFLSFLFLFVSLRFCAFRAREEKKIRKKEKSLHIVMY